MSDDNQTGQVVPFKDKKKALKDAIESSLTEIEDLIFAADPDDPKLMEMNNKHAFINSVGGRPMVLCHVYSPVANREIIEFRTPDSIVTQYSNQSIAIGDFNKPRHIELGKWWVRNYNRKEYDTVIFDPSKEREYKGCLNLWEGINCEPTKGSWKNTLAHIYRILANRDRAKFLYIIKWFAWMVQNPGEPAEVAMIFKGKQGAGKGFIFTQFLKIYGQHALSISNRKHLTGQFNGHLKLMVFLFADEAYYPGDKEVEGTLKQLITEPQIPVEDKFKTLGPSKNCLHIAMSSNNEWVIPAGEDSRRYFINEVDNSLAFNQSPNHIREAYFTRIWGEMNEGGREAMMWDLARIQLGTWHPRYNIPHTEEMKKQQGMGLPREVKYVATWLEEGIFPGTLTRHNEYKMSTQQFIKALEELDHSSVKIPTTKKSKVLTDLDCPKLRETKGIVWTIPTLAELRQRFIDAHKVKVDWNMSEEWVVSNQEY